MAFVHPKKKKKRKKKIQGGTKCPFTEQNSNSFQFLKESTDLDKYTARNEKTRGLNTRL